MPEGMKKSTDLTYKDGGTGKGTTLRAGLDLEKFGENLTRIKSNGRKMKCLDCAHFNGINPIDIVTCSPEGNKHKGLEICENNFKDEYEVEKDEL
jgi:hypothetical protein